LFAAFAIATISAASAKGVTLVQQADGSVRTYVDVNIRLSGCAVPIEKAYSKSVMAHVRLSEQFSVAFPIRLR
jgi:hypothetical protein